MEISFVRPLFHILLQAFCVVTIFSVVAFGMEIRLYRGKSYSSLLHEFLAKQLAYALLQF